VEALLASCEAAYAHGRCRRGDPSPEEALSGRVENRSSDHVAIELRVSEGTAERFVSRELTFHTEDSRTERAKAVGLTLGVIAAGLHDSRSQPPPAPAAPVSAPAPEPVQKTSAALLLLAGLARDPGLPNFEGTGALRGQLRSNTDGLILRAGLDGSRTTLQGATVTLTRVAPALGAGWGHSSEHVALALALDVGAEWLQMSAIDVGHPVEASRWSPLLRASATLFLPVLPHAGFALSTQLSWTSSPTTFFLRGEPIDGTSGAQLGGLAGVYVGTP
jgi:hypothetical protein